MIDTRDILEILRQVRYAYSRYELECDQFYLDEMNNAQLKIVGIITELQQQIEDMQCCSTCIHRYDEYDCYLSTHNLDGDKVCKNKDDWKFDNLTRKEREDETFRRY
jgi:hypothetical protein